MVGFVLIIIIVSVIILFFLGISFGGQDKEMESREAESFIRAITSFTTDCNISYEYIDFKETIFRCLQNDKCYNPETEKYDINSCDVLNSTAKEILNASWIVDEKGYIVGYEFKISENKNKIIYIEEGVKSQISKSALQNYAQSGDKIDIFFKVYKSE